MAAITGRPRLRRFASTASLLCTFLLGAFLFSNNQEYAINRNDSTLWWRDSTDTHASAALQTRAATTDSREERDFQLNFYEYSNQTFFTAAYADNRTGIKKVLLAGFFQKGFKQYLFCKCNETRSPLVGGWIQVQNADAAVWRSVILNCDVSLCSQQTLKSIVIGIADNDTANVEIPVHHVPSRKAEFLGICVKSGYGSPDPVKLVEWMELNKLLGVNHVVMYNASITGISGDVFNYYVEKDFLTVVPDNFQRSLENRMPSFSAFMKGYDATQSTGNEPYPQMQLLSLQDCFIRYRSRFKYILVVDIDEVLVPTGGLTLPQMIAYLKVSYPSATSFAFAASMYLEDFGKSNYSTSPFTHVLAHTRHSDVSYEQLKSLHSTNDTYSVNWHRRVTPFERLAVVGMHYAWLHHYRTKCKGKNCGNRNLIDDDMTRLGHYAEDLTSNVDAVVKLLKLDGAS